MVKGRFKKLQSVGFPLTSFYHPEGVLAFWTRNIMNVCLVFVFLALVFQIHVGCMLLKPCLRWCSMGAAGFQGRSQNLKTCLGCLAKLLPQKAFNTLASSINVSTHCDLVIMLDVGRCNPL